MNAKMKEKEGMIFYVHFWGRGTKRLGNFILSVLIPVTANN